MMGGYFCCIVVEDMGGWWYEEEDDSDWRWLRRWHWRQFFLGAAFYSPREATLALSDREFLATVGGVAVPFLLSGSFAVAVAVANDAAVVFCYCCCVVISSFVAVVVGRRCVALCH